MWGSGMWPRERQALGGAECGVSLLLGRSVRSRSARVIAGEQDESAGHGVCVGKDHENPGIPVGNRMKIGWIGRPTKTIGKSASGFPS